MNGIEIAAGVDERRGTTPHFVDETLIDPPSPVFATALNRAEGDVVTCRGRVVEAGVSESSHTPGGAVETPDLIFRFSGLS